MMLQDFRLSALRDGKPGGALAFQAFVGSQG